jgi:2-oxoglutarate dehydrogenase E2 component (dihydrolipoamide succinyltransferase)
VVAPAAAATEVHATPLAKKLAEEHNVDLSRVVATGGGGRIREQDVLAFVQARNSGVPSSASASNGAARASAPAGPAPSGATREKMTPIRQRIAQRLVQAQHTAAMLTTFNEVDMGEVMALRKTYKEDFEKKHGVGLGFMGFFVKAAVSALKAFPLVNASIVEEGGSLMIEKHGSCDIAVAVSTPKGLVVPVLRNCESRSVAQVEAGIKDLATRGRDGKLGLDEMQGGTFTITNGGVFGSLMSTPILNSPQSAILGMHAIKNRPVEYPAASGQIAIRPMMYLALSYDHRIIDGAEAVQFLVRIKQCIEDPQRLLLEV